MTNRILTTAGVALAIALIQTPAAAQPTSVVHFHGGSGHGGSGHAGEAMSRLPGWSE